MNRLIIIGAGGHGKVVADIAVKTGYQQICFVDDVETGECIGFPIIGNSGNLNELNDGKTDFIIAIGNNALREKIAKENAVHWVTLIHPSAQIGLNVEIGEGTVVMAGAVINVCAKIGKHSIVNSCAVVEHDNKLGDYVQIAPNVALGGMVSVGDRTSICIGAVVRNGMIICSDCVIGAGGVVVKNIEKKGVYIGVPAIYKN